MLSPTPPINRPSLHPGTGYLIGPRVPQGLAAVVEGLTREVLRHRPEDIYVFAAHHFEKLLKLREQYHAEKYSGAREFDDDIGREFNLWPARKSGHPTASPTRGWSLEKEMTSVERPRKSPTDVEESPEDVSAEKRKLSKQTCSKSTSSTRRVSRRSTKEKDSTSEPRASRIIPQMSALRNSTRTILTKDIKQELRKNKLNSGEKGKLADNVEKVVRGERRSRSKVSKADKSTEEEVERAATTAADRTSARRPLKKVRRIETESETETEREIAATDRLENDYERASPRGKASAARSGGRGDRPEAWLSGHSSGRKVSSRALSMDRIRAYVLRKFASTASLEVLRSPTYVEQVQEVIDRAAPIIKERLEEMRKPRGKRSRSADFAWSEDSSRVAKDGGRSESREDKSKKREEEEEEEVVERRKTRVAQREPSNVEDQPAKANEAIPNAENEERRPGRRSASGSGRRTKRRESGGQDSDVGLADRVDNEHKSEHEPVAGRDTLEARLTATRSILEGISMSASELSGARKADSATDEPTASSEAPDHANVVSLPIVRPPSSKGCRNAAKNGSDGSLTLPPISPEAPRSTKKKDELSLPILSPAPNGNLSAKKSQEQDADSKDAEEASTMRDITSDIEDMAALPEDEDGSTIAGQDATGDHPDLISDERLTDGEEVGKKDEEAALSKDTPRELAGKRTSDVSLDRELEGRGGASTVPEGRKVEEVYKDSLNVTPEVVEGPLRPDSLEPEEDERVENLEDDGADDDAGRNNTCDDLKDRLIEIEMAERNIEKALTGQPTAMCNDEARSEVEKPTTVEKMNDETRRSSSEAEESASEIRKSASERGASIEENESINGEAEKSASKKEKGDNNAETSTSEREDLNEEAINKNEGETDKVEEDNVETDKVEKESGNVENSTDEREPSSEGGKAIREETEEFIKTEKEGNSADKLISGDGATNGERKLINEGQMEELTKEVGEKDDGNADKLTSEIEISNEERRAANEEEEKSMNEAEDPMETSNSEINATTERTESSTIVDEKAEIPKKGSKDLGIEVLANEAEELPNVVEEVMIKRHIAHLESTNIRSKVAGDRVADTSVHEKDDKDTVTKDGKATTPNVSAAGSENTETLDERSRTSSSANGSEIGRSRTRKKRETNESTLTTPLSLKIPFSYVLSEGSPCEIPDSVTTVIIPDRPCPSPVIPEIEDHQSGSTYRTIESAAHRVDIHEDPLSRRETGQEDNRYAVEVFGEYIRPDSAVATLPVDVDFVRNAKSGQDIVIAHQDLGRIKEEGEEEEEDKEDDEEAAKDGHLEKKDDERAIKQVDEATKLEDIAEHEENEADVKSVAEATNAEEEEISSSRAREPLAENTEPTGANKKDVAVEARSTLDNSLEENGSSQDSQTITSSDAKESTVSNRSVESSSAGRPIVPELNLDSLQDNTVSSFKMTANGTVTRENNDSPRESSDTTMSLIEPLTSDEGLTMGNRLVTGRDLEASVAELRGSSPNLPLRLGVQEADRLYPAEHAEYELLERDPLSSEAILEDEAKAAVEDVVRPKASKSRDAASVDLTSPERERSTELDSEEEIAKELIGLLDKEIQLDAGESSRAAKRSEDDRERPAGSNLGVQDEETRTLDAERSVSIGETETGKGVTLPEGSGISGDESGGRVEVINELAGLAASGSRKYESEGNATTNEGSEELRVEIEEKGHAENSQVVRLAEEAEPGSSSKNNATVNRNTEDPRSEVERREHVGSTRAAPLAEFERDEFLEENEKRKMPSEKIAVDAEDKHDVVDVNLADNEKVSQDEGIDAEDTPKKQGSENVNEVEEFHEKRMEDIREECEDHGKREDMEVQEEPRRKRSSDGERSEQKTSVVNEECKREHVEVREATKSREDSSRTPTKENEDAGRDKTTSTKSITSDESIIADDQTATVEPSEKEGKIDDLSAKLESVHGPIMNAISEQSTEDYPRGRYWTMGTKSSTAETVIAAFGSNTSTDEKTETVSFDDAPKIAEDEAIVREKEDFYSAVLKVQACIRGFLARRRLRKYPHLDSVSKDVSSTQETAVASNEHSTVPEDRSSLREARNNRHRLRREEALRKTTLSLENAFATSRLQHTGEFHDSVPLPLFDTTNSETNSTDSLDESLDKEAEEERMTDDTEKSKESEKDETTGCSCHDDERPGGSQQNNVFTHRSDLPIMMQLLMGASGNCHFRLNRNSDPDPNLSAEGVKIVEPMLDILMLDYPRDDTLQNRYLNFITSVEDMASNLDYLLPHGVTKVATSMDDVQPSATSSDTSISPREPLALPGTPQGVVIEELTSLDETAGDVLSTKPPSATKTSLDTNSSILEECSPEGNHLESSPRADPVGEENAIGNQRNVPEEIEKGFKETSAAGSNSRGVEEVHGDDTGERSNGTFRNSNGHANKLEVEKT